MQYNFYNESLRKELDLPFLSFCVYCSVLNGEKDIKVLTDFFGQDCQIIIDGLIELGHLDSDLNKSEVKKYDKNDSKQVASYIRQNRSDIYAYLDFWNLFAEKYGKQKVVKLSETRKRKLRIRVKDDRFDFISILSKAANQSLFIESGWGSFDFVIDNDTNYLKILENKYGTVKKSEYDRI